MQMPTMMKRPSLLDGELFDHQDTSLCRTRYSRPFGSRLNRGPDEPRSVVTPIVVISIIFLWEECRNDAVPYQARSRALVSPRRGRRRDETTRSAPFLRPESNHGLPEIPAVDFAIALAGQPADVPR